MSSTPISQFSYDLPKELIAQHSVEPRDASRLMILDRAPTPSLPLAGEGARIQHKHFYDIVDELSAGDVLVFNDTKVFRARMMGFVGAPLVGAHETEVEVFLLRCVEKQQRSKVTEEQSFWQALLRPGKKVQVGDAIVIDDLEIIVREKHEDGVVLLEFSLGEAGVLAFTDSHGSIPIPPYVNEVPDDANKYQTVYAREVGSVAAPTAGFHFTNELLVKIKAKGVEIAFVTLHVGLGTFRPVQTETIEEHTIHAEFVTITSEVAQQINRAKKEGRRVIAVGTTTVRSLEGAAITVSSPHRGEGKGGVLSQKGTGNSEQGTVISSEGFTGDVNIFITPGFKFRVIDALITNFHLPKSTLLILVSAFAGRENVLGAYEEAVRQMYRFFSFGDAMFIR